MYLGINPQPSCASAWVAAASAIAKAGKAYNVVIDVDDPTKFDDRDNAVITLVDSFLRDRNQYPIVTVANTVFPQALYREFGAPKFYQEYHKAYQKLTKKRWGRYFERMTLHRKRDGKTYNPLQDMIDRLQQREEAKVRYKAAYELAVYDPLLDGRYFRGGQCLSFLSFKVHPKRGLTLTAMYRNHTYISRCLGNLIGLAWLQAFIAKEARLAVGPLTCISTHAQIDTAADKDKKNKWGVTEARGLILQASQILNASVQTPVTA
jgi:hypothetical protein